MAKISPVAQFLQANSAKAKLLTESHYYGKDAFGWVKKSNFVDKNSGDVIGNITSSGRKRPDSASHRVIINLQNMTEIRSQKVKFAKISDQNGKDRFVPEKISTEIKTIEDGKNPIIRKFERICKKLSF